MWLGPISSRPRRRRRLVAHFKPIVDGLFDKARDRQRLVEEEWTERDWRSGGQWQRTHPFSYDTEISESTSGNPLNTLGRAIDGVHRGDLMCVALVAVGVDGVIHTAWSDGDYEMMGKAAKFLSQDLAHEAAR